MNENKCQGTLDLQGFVYFIFDQEHNYNLFGLLRQLAIRPASLANGNA
jgi:hypothetical protein